MELPAPRVLLIGLGKVGMLYDFDVSPTVSVASHAQAFTTHGSFAVVGGVDPSEERRAQFMAKFGCQAFDDVREAAREAQADVVILASPTDMRLSHVRAVLEVSRPKVLVSEKPLAWTPEESKEIVALCLLRDTRLFVNYQRRVDVAAKKAGARILRLLSEGSLRGKCVYSKGALHSASHFVDLLTYWLGPPSGISALRKAVRYGRYDYEIDFRLRFPCGVFDFEAAGSDESPVYGLEVAGVMGTLRYEGASNRYEWSDALGGTENSQRSDFKPIHESSTTVFLEVADEIHRILQGEPTVMCDGACASQTVSLISSLWAADRVTA